jgi:structural hemagglutinin/hemolysin toxin protein RtxA
MLYQISFYVPETHCESVKSAMFAMGAGVLGDYQECAWQCLGEGQFKPLSGSQPFLGETDKLEKVREYKVEMICIGECVEDVIKALKSSHPYEVPAFTVIKLEPV